MVVNGLDKSSGNAITVQELIDELNKVEDKTIEVYIGYEGIDTTAVSCLEWNDGNKHTFIICE